MKNPTYRKSPKALTKNISESVNFPIVTVSGAGLRNRIIWGVWHIPLVVAGGYDAGTPLWYGVSCFMISVTAMSVSIVWLRLRSGSLWTATIYHAVHNVAVQGIFDGSTVDTGVTKWITTEFGIGLVITSVVIAAYFWR